MYTLCWSSKGGSGTTVVAASLALLAARRGPTVLVDLGGDSAAALGIAPPDGPGVGDWLSNSASPAERLWRLGHECGEHLQLIHSGTMPVGAEFTELAAERLASAATGAHQQVIIDAGRVVPADVLHQCAERSLMVVRSCYLALRRSAASCASATGVVLIVEPGRCLGRIDFQRALGVAATTELTWDPAVGRAVDAGLLQARLPASVSRPLERLLFSPTAPVRA